MVLGLPKGAKRLGTLPGSTQVRLTIGLRQRDGAALARLLVAGKVVPPAEYDERFGPVTSLVRDAERAMGAMASGRPGRRATP